MTPINFKTNRPLPILGWALYDFANTIFSILVVTRYLPPMLKEMTGGSSAMGAAAALSMGLAGLCVPILGAITDRTGKRKPYLLASTLLCTAATSAIAFTGGVPLIFVLFFVANLAYQVSMVFYNSLLPAVSTQDTVGTVSGLGVAMGYLGSFLAIIAAQKYVQTHTVQGVFLFTGVAFLLFSLPLFLWVRERPTPYQDRSSGTRLYHRFQDLFRTLRALPSHPSLLFFLLGNFFCLDAVNTTIIFYAEFLQYARSISAAGIDQCLIAIQLSALFFALLVGRLSDRVGPKKMILSVTGAWIVAIGLVLATQHFWVIFTASLIGGAGLGGIWVTGRALVLELSPRDKVGEFMGLYGMTGKFSALGALFFGIFADWLSYDAALALQVGVLFLGGYFFSRIKIEDAPLHHPGGLQRGR